MQGQTEENFIASSDCLEILTMNIGEQHLNKLFSTNQLSSNSDIYFHLPQRYYIKKYIYMYASYWKVEKTSNSFLLVIYTVSKYLQGNLRQSCLQYLKCYGYSSVTFTIAPIHYN